MSDDRVIWDWLKYNIRAHAKQHSKRRAKEKNEKENRLEYAKAKQDFKADPNNANSNILSAAKESLEAFYDEKLNGVLIRARARWHQHGEKSSKYFLNLKNRNHIKKHMRKLKLSGVITTDPFSILAEQKRFYQELYEIRNDTNTEAMQTIEAFLHSLNIPVLTEEQKLSCEGTISQEECASALDSFQNNKPLETMEYRLNFTENSGLLLVNLSRKVQMSVFKKVKCLFPKHKQS